MRNDRDLVAFVLRNTPGAKVDPDDIRTVQAAMAWWRKFGGESVFEAYLEIIPAAPDFVALRKEFPQLNLPTLVDPRRGHVRSAELIGIATAYMDQEDMEPCDTRHVMPSDPYWVLAHDGTPNFNRRPPDCRLACSGRLLAGIADVLMAIWLQHGPRNHVMDGPGSVRSGYSGILCSSLYPHSEGPILSIERKPDADPRYGSVVFVRG